MQYNKLVAFVTSSTLHCDTDSMHCILRAVMHILAALLFLQIICILAQCAVLRISVLVSGCGGAVDLGRDAQPSNQAFPHTSVS